MWIFAKKDDYGSKNGGKDSGSVLGLVISRGLSKGKVGSQGFKNAKVSGQALSVKFWIFHSAANLEEQKYACWLSCHSSNVLYTSFTSTYFGWRIIQAHWGKEGDGLDSLG